MHTVGDIDPGEFVNISIWFACEFTQAAPHSSRLKADASWNMRHMLVTADTSHFDRSWLKADAPWNMLYLDTHTRVNDC